MTPATDLSPESLPPQVRRFLAAVTDADVVAAGDALAEDFVIRLPAQPPVTDLHGLRDRLETLRSRWIDRSVRVTRVVGGAPHLAVAYEWSAAAADGSSGPEPFPVPATAFVLLADSGRIVQWRVQYDTAVQRRARKARRT